MVLAVFFGTSTKAQTKAPNPWRFGIGLETGVSTGDNVNSKFELGGTARLQYRANSVISYTLTSGYYNLFNVNYYSVTTGVITTQQKSFGIVPLKMGIKVYFLPKIYFGAEAGAAFQTSVSENARLDLSPGLGYSTRSWEVGARYENFSRPGSDSYGLVGLRIAYGFGL